MIFCGELTVEAGESDYLELELIDMEANLKLF